MKETNAKAINRLHRDRGSRFNDRDSDMDWLCDIIDKSNMSIGDIIEAVLDASGNTVHISYGCIARWLDGTTRRPQNFTLTWVAVALGYTRDWKATPKLELVHSQEAVAS